MRWYYWLSSVSVWSVNGICNRVYFFSFGDLPRFVSQKFCFTRRVHKVDLTLSIHFYQFQRNPAESTRKISLLILSKTPADLYLLLFPSPQPQNPKLLPIIPSNNIPIPVITINPILLLFRYLQQRPHTAPSIPLPPNQKPDTQPC